MKKPLYYLETIYDLSIARLEEHNKKVIFLDADNTLFIPKLSLEKQELITIREKLLELKSAGFIIIIISNNFSQDKAQFFENLAIPTFFFAKKPLPFVYKKAHQRAEELLNYSLSKTEILHVGDQFLTDAIGSILYKIDYVLIEPIDENQDLLYAKPSRFLEKLFNIHKKEE